MRSRTVAAPNRLLPTTLGRESVSPEVHSTSATCRAVGLILPCPPPLSMSSPEHVHGRRSRCTAAAAIKGLPPSTSCLFWTLLSPVHLLDTPPLPLRRSSSLHGRSVAASRRSTSGSTAVLSSPFSIGRQEENPRTMKLPPTPPFLPPSISGTAPVSTRSHRRCLGRRRSCSSRPA